MTLLLTVVVLGAVALAHGQNRTATVVESVFDETIEEVFYPGDQSNLVFALTRPGNLWRSEDGGVSWTDQGPLMANYEEEGARIAFVIPSPADATGNHILFVSDTNLNWFTSDGGKTYRYYDSKVNIETVIMHPTLANVFVVLEATEACFSFLDRSECNTQAFITQDFGESFELLEKYVYKVEFGPKAVDANGKPVVLVSSYAAQAGDQTRLPFIEQKLWKFDMTFEEGKVQAYSGFFRKLVLDKSFGFIFLPKFLFAVSYAQGEGNVQPMLMWASADGGETMRQARFPENLTTSSQITLVDASDVMSIILYTQAGAFGSLYLSDADGLYYGRTIERVRRREAHSYDYYNPRGIEGVFLVNQALSSGLNPLHGTLLTTDKGGKWAKLKGPTTDINGDAYDCSGTKCDLHLEMSREYRPVTSSRAVGMVLAHGNTGSNLAAREEAWKPYVSRDAGVTWRETVKPKDGKGTVYHATIGFKGSIIMMIDQLNPATEFLYTLDEGKTWKVQENAWNATTVSFLHHHRLLSEESFLMHGTRQIDNDLKGILVHVDFAALGVRTCGGVGAPDTANSDYETYVPSTTAPGCLLGRKVQFVRRKQDVECVDTIDYTSKVLFEPCACVRDDYECDFGYDYDAATTVCKRNMQVRLPGPEEQCATPGARFYYEFTGYRKVPADQCVDGEQLGRVSKACDTVVPRTLPPTTESEVVRTTAMATTTMATMAPTPQPTTVAVPVATTAPTPLPSVPMDQCVAEGFPCGDGDVCCGRLECTGLTCIKPDDVGGCGMAMQACDHSVDCCGELVCDTTTKTCFACAASAPCTNPPDGCTVDEAASQIDVHGCTVFPTCEAACDTQLERGTGGGVGAGIIALLVVLALLCLGLCVFGAYKYRNRGSYEVHGGGGDTPMSGTMEDGIAEMELESDDSS